MYKWLHTSIYTLLSSHVKRALGQERGSQLCPNLGKAVPQRPYPSDLLCWPLVTSKPKGSIFMKRPEQANL